MRIRGGRLVVGAVTFLLGGAYLWQSLQLDFGTMDQPGAALFPTLVSVLVMVSAVVVVSEEFAPGTRSEGQAEFALGRERRRVGWFFGILFGFGLLLSSLGFLLASFGATTGLVRFVGGRSWRTSALVGLVVAVASYYVFVEVLGVPMPEGIFAPTM